MTDRELLKQALDACAALREEIERLLKVRVAAQDLIDYEDAGPDDGRGGWLHWEEKFDALRSVLK